MAYTNIMNQIAQKQNVFGQQQPQAGQQQQQGFAPETKTTTANLVGGGGDSSTQAQAGDAPDSASAAAVQSNISRSGGAVGGINRLASSVQDQRAQQQQAANKFVQSAQAQQVGQADIDRAISGDQDAGSTISRLMSGQRQMAGRFDAPRVDTSRARSFFDDQGRLSTSGLAREFQRGGGQNYTRAQSAFDAALARRNQDVQRGAFDLNQQLTEAEEADANIGRETQEQAQAKIDAQIAEQRGDVSRYLTGQQGQLRTLAEEQARAANQAAAAQSTDQVTQGIIDRLAASNPGQADLFREAAGKVGNLDSYRTPGTTVSSLYDDDQASRYNRILSLLGQGGEMVSAGGGPEGPGFRENDYREAILAQADLLAKERAVVPELPGPPEAPVVDPMPTPQDLEDLGNAKAGDRQELQDDSRFQDPTSKNLQTLWDSMSLPALGKGITTSEGPGKGGGKTIKDEIGRGASQGTDYIKTLGRFR